MSGGLHRQRLVSVLVAALGLAACGGGAPIGHPGSPSPASYSAPALVQVENSPDARPHAGLQKADLIYEYLTEGGITRFTVIYFAPGGANPIGPVRSARLVTLRLQKAYGGVLFYSGASDHVLGQIQAGHVPALDESADGGRYYLRHGDRPAPHNLYTAGARLAEGVSQHGSPVGYPPLAHAEPTGGDPFTNFAFDQTYSHHVAYSYSASSRTYTYTSETGPEVDTANQSRPLQISSVVLIRVPHHDAGYTEDVLGAEGIDYDLVGSGPADVYTRGSHLAAKWDLSDANHPLQLLDQSGRELKLPDGLTWIHLVDPDQQVS